MCSAFAPEPWKPTTSTARMGSCCSTVELLPAGVYGGARRCRPLGQAGIWASTSCDLDEDPTEHRGTGPDPGLVDGGVLPGEPHNSPRRDPCPRLPLPGRDCAAGDRAEHHPTDSSA